MGKETALVHVHREAGARMVDFSGWDMPVHYGSQIEEHHAVRSAVGMFDVSHMTVLDLKGPRQAEFLDHLLANDVLRAGPGKAAYTAMLREDGGILDDLIVYPLPDGYRLVVNCATRDKDIEWISSHGSAFDCQVVPRDDLAIIAVQGPGSLGCCADVLGDAHGSAAAGLAPFEGALSGEWYLARTGYTGEQGLEIILPNNEAEGLWRALAAAGAKPAGLGARDTLRLEAGLNLYGNDMDETVTPYECNIGWTVSLEGRDFIGADALRRQRESGVARRLLGVVMRGRGVMRHGHTLCADGEQVGEVTSGAFSPTLGISIGLARLNEGVTEVSVEIRGRQHAVELVRPPFVKNGREALRPVKQR